MKRFLLAILSISVLSVNPIISCNDRIIYYGNNTDIATEDGSGDTGIHNELPDDICPERYTENNLELFPAPKNIFGTDRRIEVKNFEFITDGNKDIDDFFNEFTGFYRNTEEKHDGDITNLRIYTFSGIKGLSEKCKISPTEKPDSYYLKIIKELNGAVIYIVADGKEGFLNGAKTIAHLLYKQNLIETAIFDYPDVKFRGVAEAFYGKPWDSRDRLDVMYFLAMLKFNMFLYSPKSDPYAWAMWRTPFDSAEEDKLRELARQSKRLGIIPCYGVGPGYDIKFSNNKDYSTLLYKYRKLISFGFDSCLVLAFDDTQKSLSDEDIGKFTDMAEAQIYLAKRLYEDIRNIKPDIMMAFVPNDYTTNWAKNDTYLRKISIELKNLYSIAWTGPEVVSPSITTKDIDEIESIMQVTPVIADNYPVCDLMFNGGAAFLGPITGREAAIFKRITMYASNPMRYAISNIIPLGTIADMLWSPEKYESETSFLNSIKFFAKTGREKDIYEFATNLRSSLISGRESPELKEEIENFLKEAGNCESIHYQTLKESFFERFISMEEILKGASDRRFTTEMRPWISKLKDYGIAGNRALELLKKKCTGEKISEQELRWFEQTNMLLKEDKYRICGEIMNNFLSQVYERITD